MGKITRAESKLHDEALALLSLDRALTDDEIELVYRQYNPMAEHNVGKGAIFFTPWDIASTFSIAAENNGSIIDLCAGIGILTRHMVLRNRWTRMKQRLVCVEVSSVFVEIGKKLVPEAEWYCNDVFDLDFLTSIGTFDLAISNPPYGQIPGKSEWTIKAPAQWQVMEVALRLSANGGMFIIPEVDVDYHINDYSGGYYRRKPNKDKHLAKRFPGVLVMPSSFPIGDLKDQWQGATPDVVIADIGVDDVEWQRPYGFLDVARMIDVPKVKVKREPKPESKPKEVSEYEQTSML